MLSDLLGGFLIPLAIGGLVGLEREINKQEGGKSFAGIRTYILTSFIAAVCAYLLSREEWRMFAYIVLAGMVLLTVASHTVSAIQGFVGITTELSIIMVFLLSFLATNPEYQKMAVILGVILAVLLSMKDNLHKLARETQKIEWYDGLTFIFMAFVVLPLLPNESFPILGVADAVNPYRTWLMVVFVSGVSFVGYFLTKVIGGSYGVGLAGLMGGLVSSTAVTESMAADSKRNPLLVNSYAFGVIGACVIMSLRVLFEVWVINSSMLSSYAVPVLVMAAIGVLAISQWVGREELKNRRVNIKLGTPLALKPALLFGIFYLVVGFVSKAMMMFNVGTYGFAALGIISGLLDVDAITLTMTNMFAHGTLGEMTAWSTIIIAIISNTFFKLFAARLFGSLAFFKKVGLALLAMAVGGIISLLVYVL